MQNIASVSDTYVDIEIDESRHNLTAAPLVEEAVRNGEGMLAADGALVVSTGHYTGRSPKDKFVVEELSSKDKIWWGSVNQPISEAHFDTIRARMLEYVRDKQLYVQDVFVGSDPEYRLAVRVYTETAWANLFARNLFIRPTGRSWPIFSPSSP